MLLIFKIFFHFSFTAKPHLRVKWILAKDKGYKIVNDKEKKYRIIKIKFITPLKKESMCYYRVQRVAKSNLSWDKTNSKSIVEGLRVSKRIIVNSDSSVNKPQYVKLFIVKLE